MYWKLKWLSNNKVILHNQSFIKPNRIDLLCQQCTRSTRLYSHACRSKHRIPSVCVNFAPTTIFHQKIFKKPVIFNVSPLFCWFWSSNHFSPTSYHGTHHQDATNGALLKCSNCHFVQATAINWFSFNHLP